MRELSDNEFNEIFNNHIQDLKQNGYDIIDPDGFDGYGHHYIEYKDNDGSTFVDVFFVDEENENVKIVGQEVFQNSVSEEVSNIVDAIDTGNLMFFDGDIETIPFSKNNSSGTLIEQEDDNSTNQLETEINTLKTELETLKREKEQKYEELKNSEYDEELNKEIKELEEKVKQKQDEINNKESLLTKQTTNNKIDDLKYNINEPETNEPVTESVEDFKEDNFENEDYWKFLNLIKNYFVSKSGYTFVDSIKNGEETSESTLLIFSNTYEYEGKKEVEIVTVYVVDDVNDDPDDEKFVFVLERSFNINDYVNTEEEMTLDDNEKIKRIILMGTNVKNFDEQTDKVFKVSHNEISNFDGDSLIGLKQIELNHTDLSPKNKEQDLPDEDKEVLIEEQDDFGMSDIKDKLKNIIINTQQEEGLYYIEEETEIIDNKIVMVFRGEPEEIEDNINTVDNVHVCTITFDDSNRCQYLLERYFTIEDYNSIEDFKIEGTKIYSREPQDKYHKITYENIINHEGDTMVGLPMMEIDLNNNVINKESLKESFMEKYGVNDLEGLYEWIENYEIYSDKGGKTFMSKVTNLINELSNTGYNELKELENDIKEKHMGDEPLSNEELKQFIEDELMENYLKESKYNKDLNNLLEI